jgi:hypothetical protein
MDSHAACMTDFTNLVWEPDSKRSLVIPSDNGGIENRPFNSPSTTGLADLSFVGNNLPLGCTRFLQASHFLRTTTQFSLEVTLIRLNNVMHDQLPPPPSTHTHTPLQ